MKDVSSFTVFSITLNHRREKLLILPISQVTMSLASCSSSAARYYCIGHYPGCITHALPPPHPPFIIETPAQTYLYDVQTLIHEPQGRPTGSTGQTQRKRNWAGNPDLRYSNLEAPMRCRSAMVERRMSRRKKRRLILGPRAEVVQILLLYSMTARRLLKLQLSKSLRLVISQARETIGC